MRDSDSGDEDERDTKTNMEEEEWRDSDSSEEPTELQRQGRKSDITATEDHTKTESRSSQAAESRSEHKASARPKSVPSQPHSSNNPPPAPQGATSRAGTDQQLTDPVKDTFYGEVDLYDIATWEVRTPLDSFAVSLTNRLEQAKTSLLVATALLLFLAQMGFALAFFIDEPLLAVLTLLSVIPAGGVAIYIWYGDPTTREPLVLLAATFVLAIIFATGAAIVNTVFQPVFDIFGVLGLIAFYFIIVGPIEEFVKWLAIRVYAYRSDVFRTVLDGAVYGAVAGLGFAAIENFVYIVSSYYEMADVGIQAEYATFVAGQRAFAGPGHVIFSAWAGFYLGLAKFNPGNRGPIVVKGLLIATFIHALYNTLVTLLPLTIITLFVFIVFYHGFWFGLLYRKISKYRTLYQRIETPRTSGHGNQ